MKKFNALHAHILGATPSLRSRRWLTGERVFGVVLTALVFAFVIIIAFRLR